MTTPYRFAFVLLSLALLTPRVGSSPKPKGQENADFDQRSFVSQVVTLTNAERVKANLPPLKLHESLCASAQWMARDMADHNYLEHTDRQGRSIDPRIPGFGYAGYQNLGENIAGGQTSPAEVVADWMKSPAHRANILDPDLREIGVGYAVNRDSAYKTYWVQDFGGRFHVFPLVINDESGRTRNPDVRLRLYGGEWATKVRFSNDGVSWTDWEDYRSARDWTLLPGAGKHIVYAEITNGHAKYAVHDEVELLPETPYHTVVARNGK